MFDGHLKDESIRFSLLTECFFRSLISLTADYGLRMRFPPSKSLSFSHSYHKRRPCNILSLRSITSMLARTSCTRACPTAHSCCNRAEMSVYPPKASPDTTKDHNTRQLQGILYFHWSVSRRILDRSDCQKINNSTAVSAHWSEGPSFAWQSLLLPEIHYPRQVFKAVPPRHAMISVRLLTSDNWLAMIFEEMHTGDQEQQYDRRWLNAIWARWYFT
jgi:hypothetical protein